LKKSQSAVWSQGYSRAGQSETIEHGPVMSTDKLEKPKHNNNQQPTSQTSSNPPSAPCTGSLPRRNASGVFYRTPQDFVGGSQSNLRRNCSMNDLQQKNQDNQSSWLPAPPPQVEEGFQVPPSMVRSIVITVLQGQGVTNPTEEMLDRAIEEYYAKNPHGVQVQSNTSTFPRARAQSYQTLNNNVDFERAVHSQPYRTSPLVTPAPRTISEMRAGGSSYQHPRGPQYERPKPSTQKSEATETKVEPASGITTARAVSSSPRQQRQVMGRPIVHSSSLSRSGSTINQSKSFKKVMADVMHPAGTDM